MPLQQPPGGATGKGEPVQDSGSLVQPPPNPLHDLLVRVDKLENRVVFLENAVDAHRRTLQKLTTIIDPSSGNMHVKGILEVDQKVTLHDDVEMDNAAKNVLVHGDVKLV